MQNPKYQQVQILLQNVSQYEEIKAILHNRFKCLLSSRFIHESFIIDFHDMVYIERVAAREKHVFPTLHVTGIEFLKEYNIWLNSKI